MGLDLKNAKNYLKKDIEVPEEILEMIEKRANAKKEKNYELADKLRDEIKEKGYIIKDTANGVNVEKI